MVPLSDGSTHESRHPTSGDLEAADGTAEAPAPPQLSVVEEPRRYPSTIGGACYLTLLGLMVFALVVIGVGHWRDGVHVLAGVIVAASALRGLLRQRDSGMLAVRSRWFDVTLLAVVGVALWVLASTVPNQV